MIFVGFDYIRKKKRPAPNGSENPMSVNNIIKKRLAAMENLENKDENDISKEIKGWVLNKGVGESVLHKASRLDYVVSSRSVKSLKNEEKNGFCYNRIAIDCNRSRIILSTECGKVFRQTEAFLFSFRNIFMRYALAEEFFVTNGTVKKKRKSKKFKV